MDGSSCSHQVDLFEGRIELNLSDTLPRIMNMLQIGSQAILAAVMLTKALLRPEMFYLICSLNTACMLPSDHDIVFFADIGVLWSTGSVFRLKL